MLGTQNRFVIDTGTADTHEGYVAAHRTLASNLHGFDRPWLAISNGGRSSQPNTVRHLDNFANEFHNDVFVTGAQLKVKLFDKGKAQFGGDHSAPDFTPSQVLNADSQKLQNYLQQIDEAYAGTTTGAPEVLSELTRPGSWKQPNFKAEAEVMAMNWANVYNSAASGAGPANAPAEFTAWMGTVFGQNGTALLNWWVNQVSTDWNNPSASATQLMTNLRAGTVYATSAQQQSGAVLTDFSQIEMQWTWLLANKPTVALQIATDFQNAGTSKGYISLPTMNGGSFLQDASGSLLPETNAVGLALTNISYQYYLANGTPTPVAPTVPLSPEVPANTIPPKPPHPGREIEVGLAVLAVAAVGLWLYSR